MKARIAGFASCSRISREASSQRYKNDNRQYEDVLSVPKYHPRDLRSQVYILL